MIINPDTGHEGRDEGRRGSGDESSSSSNDEFNNACAEGLAKFVGVSFGLACIVNAWINVSEWSARKTDYLTNMYLYTDLPCSIASVITRNCVDFAGEYIVPTAIVAGGLYAGYKAVDHFILDRRKISKKSKKTTSTKNL